MGMQAWVGVRSQFSIHRRDNHALGVTLGRYTNAVVYFRSHCCRSNIIWDFAVRFCGNELKLVWLYVKCHRFKLLGHFQRQENGWKQRIFQKITTILFNTRLWILSFLCSSTVTSQNQQSFPFLHLSAPSFQKRFRQTFGYLRTFGFITPFKVSGRKISDQFGFIMISFRVKTRLNG